MFLGHQPTQLSFCFRNKHSLGTDTLQIHTSPNQESAPAEVIEMLEIKVARRAGCKMIRWALEACRNVVEIKRYRCSDVFCIR